MVFSNAWAQPFCSPTRATVITGLFEDKTNVAAYDEPMSTSHTTFVQRLKDEAELQHRHVRQMASRRPGAATTAFCRSRMGFELFKGHLDSAIAYLLEL